jgi:hypothetical protein
VRNQAILTVLWLLLLASPARAEAPGEGLEAVWSIITALPGDTVQSLAARFHMEEDALLEANPQVRVVPRPGERLRVFSAIREEERFRMTVRTVPGLRLADLAQRYNLSEDALMRLNGYRTAPRFRGGERVTVYVPRSLWPGNYLDGGIQLQEGTGLLVRRPNNAWGRPVVVRSLEQVGMLMALTHPGTKLVVGDLSRQRGGRFSPHSSHKEGLDVDIGLYRPGVDYDEQYKNLRAEELDLERTWFLVKALIDTGRVHKILLDWNLQAVLYDEAVRTGATDADLARWFQYPNKRWDETGVIRHWRGHRHHIHVRFKEREGEALL